MARLRHALKVIGPCAVALLALGASSARAEVGANWMLKGSNVTAGLSPSVTIKEVEEAQGGLVTKVAGTKTEVACTKAELIGMKLEVEGKVTSGGKAKFSGCMIRLNGAASSSCEPHNGAEKGVIVTNAAKGLLILNSGQGVTRFEPVSGETLVTIQTSEECPIGEKLPVIGKFAVKDSALSTETTSHLVTEGPSTEMWVISKTAEHTATLSGSAVLQLSGEHAGLQWSGLPA